MLSPYANKLDSVAKQRYVVKIGCVDADPYAICRSECKSVLDCESNELPDVEYPDIYHYLINTPGGFSGQCMKAYKSLDAYNYFISGWVRELLVSVKGSKFVILSKVLHSQRLSEPPLQVWVICEKDGCVVCGHCNCMAGLGETCSHVAATLFAIDSVVKMKKDTSCTSLPNTWLAPSNSRAANVVPSPASEMDFSNARKRCQVVGSETRAVKRCPEVASATEGEKESFYKGLHASGVNSVILSAIPGYTEHFEKSANATLPAPLTELYSSEHANLSFAALIDKSRETFVRLSVTPDEMGM
ncbi:PREDICTED: uncharacterized protein LOC106804701 isoform X2 [Priapulus caudatus]|uniref:Uncharacterized protein LOC106804701 isoform X2 n=1 Tax=Priapulus caudatus TaxID=37621 RepID=A0ABM1DNF7_PRICU|nr:PREDICTED: uncharacterized protein LOC106804701 isoform X2 [Priapulus caudatus]